jgi:purine-binding chemotaxis protein CheW
MNAADMIQLVVFRVGDQEFACEILQVERVLRYERPSPVPKAPGFLEGVVPYAGGVVPVVDLRKRLELPAPITPDVRVLLLRLDDERVGVLVDEVREILRVDSRKIAAPPPLVRGLAAAYVLGMLAEHERTIVILNAARLLSATERLALQAAE